MDFVGTSINSDLGMKFPESEETRHQIPVGPFSKQSMSEGPNEIWCSGLVVNNQETPKVGNRDILRGWQGEKLDYKICRVKFYTPW